VKNAGKYCKRVNTGEWAVSVVKQYSVYGPPKSFGIPIADEACNARADFGSKGVANLKLQMILN
jgi:hypothetical protein